MNMWDANWIGEKTDPSNSLNQYYYKVIRVDGI
jgi:hypothetical protein